MGKVVRCVVGRMGKQAQEVGRQTDEVTRQTKGNNLHCELSISLRGERDGKEGSGTVAR